MQAGAASRRAGGVPWRAFGVQDGWLPEVPPTTATTPADASAVGTGVTHEHVSPIAVLGHCGSARSGGAGPRSRHRLAYVRSGSTRR
jgi:hypothetical protein